MSKTRTHRTVIGNDGELTTPIAEQTSEESLYAALPRLFLLDPAHAAYIAGKKLKPAVQKRRRSLSGQTIITWVSVLGFASVYFFILSRELGVAFIFTVAILIVLGSVTAWLLDLLSTLKEKRAKRYMFTHGVLLKGEITYYRPRMPHKENSQDDGVQRSVISENDEIGYRFVTPKGCKIDAEQLVPRKGKRGDAKHSVRVEVGTPVAVLYVDDHRYMLL